MSHHLSRRPCPSCNCDTLHFAQKCTGCGRIDLNPSEQRTLRFKGVISQVQVAYGREMAVQVINATRARINAEKRDWEKRTGNRDCDRPPRRSTRK